MDEFVGRMATQRHVLDVVNRRVSREEKLFGLSNHAIERWSGANKLGSTSKIVCLLRQISVELFFLATRSQEPVSSEYEVRRERIIASVSMLERSFAPPEQIDDL